MVAKLKKITQKEFDTAVKNHFKYLKGGEEQFRVVLRDRFFD